MNSTQLKKTPDFSISYRNQNMANLIPLEQYHDSYEIAFFVKADIKVFLMDKQYKINDGEIMLVGENEIHKIIYAPNMYYSRYVINFKKSYIYDVLKTLDVGELLDEIVNMNTRKIRPNLKEWEFIKDLLQDLLEQNEILEKSEKPSKYIIANIKLKLCQLLICLSKQFKQTTHINIMHNHETQVKDIIKYIDINFPNELTLDLLEKEFYISKFHIVHIFKEVTGFTVFEYLQLKRIIEAQDMLKNSKLSIIEISLACGFNNNQHFYRVFKKFSKHTPMSYRKSQ